VPWHKEHTPPTATVAYTWRAALGPAPLKTLQDVVPAAVDAEHRDRRDRAVKVGGLDVGSIDGSLTRLPDSADNRPRSARPAPPTTPPPTHNSGSCGPATPRPAPPWAWSPAPPAPAPNRTKGKPNRSSWTGC
jgi:hypothetical protein